MHLDQTMLCTLDVSKAVEDLEGEWSSKDPRESWVALNKGPRGEHFVVEVDVGGRKCGAFIDNGSTQNYISRDCFERLHLQDRVRHLSRPVASTLANKERMIVTDYIKDVVCTFSYGGGELNHKISFLVSDDLPFEMLLGMYYLEVAKPQFDLDKKVLKHKLPDGRTVRLTKFKASSTVDTYGCLCASAFYNYYKQNEEEGIMLDDAKKYVEICQVCQRDKPRTQAPLGLLKPLPIPDGSGLSVSMDFMDILVTSKSGKRHIFVIIDRFTKYARLIPMPETATTKYVIKLFKDNWVRDFGLPKTIISDRDVRFTTELWKKTAEQMGSQLQMTSGNHPEANGQAEQMNRVVQHLQRHYIKPSQDDWDEQLPLIASLYNNAIHSSTDVSPNQLHLGWKPRSALGFLLPENRPAATPGTLEYSVQYEKLLQEAVEHMKKAQQAMIASENQHRRQSTFQVGERVWVKATLTRSRASWKEQAAIAELYCCMLDGVHGGPWVHVAFVSWGTRFGLPAERQGQIGKLSTAGSDSTTLSMPSEPIDSRVTALRSDAEVESPPLLYSFEDYVARLVPTLGTQAQGQDVCAASSLSGSGDLWSSSGSSRDSAREFNIEVLDPLTSEDFAWLPLPTTGRLSGPQCTALCAHLHTYLSFYAPPTSSTNDEVVVGDILAYVTKVAREFHTQRYDDNNTPLMYVRIQVGQASCSALLDSGASRNFMSQAFMQRVGLGAQARRKANPMAMKLSDGKTQQLLDRYIEVVPVYFAPLACEPATFDILDTDFDIILGMPWLARITQSTSTGGLLAFVTPSAPKWRLDLKSGYHQISIRPNDRYKSVFKTQYEHFEWVVMPFGLTNAPTTFQAAILPTSFVQCWTGSCNILVYSQTLEDHLGHLRRVLEALRLAKYKANRDKCEFARQELEYSGHFVTPEGISALSDKIQAIQEWSEPRNVTDVRSFLGLAGYYQRFIKGYSKITAHLTKLQCEERPFDFGEEARESFLALKAALLSTEVLHIYDPLLPTRVTTDASGYGIGAVLEQHDGVDWHPVEYFSKKVSVMHSLNDARKELLAFVHALKRWRHFLLGRSQFRWVTDNNPLVFYKTQDTINSTIARCMAFIDQFDFYPDHIPGKSNRFADALSRRPDHCTAVYSTFEIDDDLRNSFIRGYQADPEFCDKYANCSSHYQIQEWYLLVHIRGKDLLCVPSDPHLHTRLLGKFDNAPATRHFGVNRMIGRLRKRFWWHGLLGDVTRYSESCEVCRRCKSRHHRPYGELRPLPVPLRRREAIAMDINGPFPKHKTGVDGILTVVDRLTTFAMFLPCCYHAKAPELVEVLYAGWIRTKGYPKEIVCDCDTRFMSDFWLALIKRWGSSLKPSSARHPQTDGQTKRAHQTAQILLSTLIRPDQKDWVEWLPDVELAYNSSIHPAIGTSPFEFEHGSPVTSPLDTITPRTAESDDHLFFLHRMQELLVKARDQMAKTQQRMSQQANHQRLPCPFRPGDLVWVSAVELSLEQDLSHKLLLDGWGLGRSWHPLGMHPRDLPSLFRSATSSDTDVVAVAAAMASGNARHNETVATPNLDPAIAGPSCSFPYMDRKAAQLPSQYDGKDDIESWINSMRSYFDVLGTPLVTQSSVLGTTVEPAVGAS
ncbi:hypothetical protein CBR_g37337 [Chara braunii]|uniref:Integrase catalytic domain-containing protein n=1 Tax=Chara braunii TaxID=69332 RepID=A0A388JZK8_CHABU|nr:hypothetical protein CBR_g37337 [Chara braunii]|eukprot:GBG63251.1 hypothetical protein CBR_g37337 [Chara braunii]